MLIEEVEKERNTIQCVSYCAINIDISKNKIYILEFKFKYTISYLVHISNFLNGDDGAEFQLVQLRVCLSPSRLGLFKEEARGRIHHGSEDYLI